MYRLLGLLCNVRNAAMEKGLLTPEGGILSYALFRRAWANAMACLLNSDTLGFSSHLHVAMYHLMQSDYGYSCKEA